MSEQIDLIKRWIQKGDHDLGTAKITFLHIPEYLDTVTYHCQQAVEKYLKSYLIFLSTNFRFTHDLIYLIELISRTDPDCERYYDPVSELQSYAVEVRYPNETIYLTDAEVKNALKIAKEIRDFVTNKMNVKIDYNDIIDK